MGRTLDVSGDDVAAAESGGFALFPAGEYVGIIKDVKASPTGYAKSGDHADTKKYPALNLVIQITESGTGKGVGKKFYAWQVPDFKNFAKGGVAFLFIQFYKALGVEFPKEGESGTVDLPDLDDILGSEIGFRVSIEEGDKSKGYKDRNKVAGFFSPDKELAQSKPADTADAEGADFTL